MFWQAIAWLCGRCPHKWTQLAGGDGPITLHECARCRMRIKTFRTWAGVMCVEDKLD